MLSRLCFHPAGLTLGRVEFAFDGFACSEDMSRKFEVDIPTPLVCFENVGRSGFLLPLGQSGLNKPSTKQPTKGSQNPRKHVVNQVG